MAAGGFLGSFRTRNDFVAPVMAKSISLAKQFGAQGSPAARSASPPAPNSTTAAARRVCAISAQESANPDHAAQMRCQAAAHRQGMSQLRTALRSAGGRNRNPRQPALRCREETMGRTSSLICFILALLTVLSITPAFLLFCACELSPSCIARSFGNFLVGPVRRAQAGRCDPARLRSSFCSPMSLCFSVPPTPGRARLQ